MNLTTKVIIFVVFACTILSTGLGLVVYSNTQSALQESISQNQLQLAKTTMSTIDRVLYERYLNIQDLAGSVIITKFLSGSAIKEEVQQRLDSFFETSGPWDALEIYDKNENLIFSSEKDWRSGDKTHNTEEKVMFGAALKGQVYVSDVITSADFAKPTVYFAAPVKDRNIAANPIVAVVMGQFSWPAIEEIISEAGGRSTHVHLFNKDELMIATNGDRKNLFNEATKYIHDPKFPHGKTISNIIKSNEGFPALVSQVFQPGYLGYKGSGWGLIMETPAEIAFALATTGAIRSTSILVLFVIVASLIFLLILYFLILQPIAKLDLTVQDISLGKLDKRAEVTSHDEIGKLAASFNAMTDSLVKASDYVRGIMKTMPTALIVMDKDGKITSVNDASIRLLGWSQEELVGKEIQSIFSTTTTTTTTTLTAVGLLNDLGLEKLASEKHIDGLRAYMKDRTGKQVPVSLSASLLVDEKQDIVNIVFIAKDLRELTAYAHARLTKITPVLQKVSTGDFSQSIEIPKDEDEFTEHMVALNLMIDDFRQMVEDIRKKSEELEAQSEELEQANVELEESKTSLEQKVQDRTAELEKAKVGLEQKVAQRTAELQKLNTSLEEEVAKRTRDLQDKIMELEKFNRIAVGRELKMAELKAEIARLSGGGKGDLT